MLGLILPLSQVLMLWGLLSAFLGSQYLFPISVVVLSMLYWVNPGYSLIGKLDRYLCLDGVWISNWRWIFAPGESFYRRRQLDFALLFVLVLLFFWRVEDEVELSSVNKTLASHQNADSKPLNGDRHLSGAELSLKKTLAADEILGWNLMQKSKRVEGAVAPSSDEVHFYRENWINRLPYEWQND